MKNPMSNKTNQHFDKFVFIQKQIHDLIFLFLSYLGIS